MKAKMICPLDAWPLLLSAKQIALTPYHSSLRLMRICLLFQTTLPTLRLTTGANSVRPYSVLEFEVLELSDHWPKTTL